MAQVEKLLVFLASPGDVQAERRHVEDRIAEFNRTIAAARGVILQLKSWERDTHPGYGQDAQSLINAQIAEMSQYALFVGIMWNRFGSQTGRAGSGTVEEFERAVQSFERHGQPAIWFYFRDSPATLNTDEQLEQRKKVLGFRERVKANGLPWMYKTPPEFRDKFYNQLILWINGRQQPAADAPATIAAEPSIRVDGASLDVSESGESDGFIPMARITLTNVGDGLAHAIDLAVWVFMTSESQFTVPGDDERGRPHFTGSASSLMSRESIRLDVLRSIKASEEGRIPLFTRDAVPIIVVTITYRDKNHRPFVEKNAFAGAPRDHVVSGYDHEPKKE